MTDSEYFDLVMQAEDQLEECGSCGAYHRKDYWGDCRNDAQRFASPEDYLERTQGIKSRE